MLMLTLNACSTCAVDPAAVTNRLFWGTSTTLNPWFTSHARTADTSAGAGEKAAWN